MVCPSGQRQAVLHHDPAAQCHGHAAHGPCVPAHLDGRAHPPASHGRRQHALATRHGSRGYRDTDGRRAPIECRGPASTRHGPRSVRQTRVGMEGAIRRHDFASGTPPGQFRRLVARPLHDGRRTVACRDRSVRAPARGRAHLSRPAAGELGSGAAHRAVRSRGDVGGRTRLALASALSVERWQRTAGGGDDAS